MNRKDFLSIFGLSILGTAVVGSDTFTAATKDVEEYPEGTVGWWVNKSPGYIKSRLTKRFKEHFHRPLDEEFDNDLGYMFVHF